MTAAQLEDSSDIQLLHALELIGQQPAVLQP